MAAALVTWDELAEWANAPAVPESILQSCVDEAEASLLADVDVRVTEITKNKAALAVAHGEVLRRGQRLLGRRNSPEGQIGVGEFGVAIPIRDPDSVNAVNALRNILVPEWGIA